jgi:hypothetical protein
MTEEIIIKPKKLNLYRALEIGYLRNESKQKKRLKKFGYKLIPEFTNREHVVAFNPENKKLIYISNGTDFSNSRDVQNDILGLTGAQKSSRRYEEEKNTLLKAKKELQPKSTTLVSHSLGSQYTNYIADKNDRVIQANPYYTPGAKARPNVENYRTATDLVSTFAPKENTQIIKTPSGMNLLKAHNIEEFKTAPVFV